MKIKTGLVFVLVLAVMAMFGVGASLAQPTYETCIAEPTLAQYIEQANGDPVTLIGLLNVFFDANAGQPGGPFGAGDILAANVVLWGNLGVTPPPELVQPILSNGGWGVFRTLLEYTIPPSSTGGRWMNICLPTPTPTATDSATATFTPTPTNTSTPTPTATATNTATPTPTATFTPSPTPTRDPVLVEPRAQTSSWFWWIVDTTSTLDEAIQKLDARYDSQAECQFLGTCHLYGGTLEVGNILPPGSVFWGGDLGSNWEETYPQLESFRNAGGVGYFKVNNYFTVPNGLGGRYLLEIQYTFMPLVKK